MPANTHPLQILGFSKIISIFFELAFLFYIFCFFSQKANAFCLGDWMCGCDERCNNWSCERLTAGLVPTFCASPIYCTSRWDIDNHTVSLGVTHVTRIITKIIVVMTIPIMVIQNQATVV